MNMYQCYDTFVNVMKNAHSIWRTTTMMIDFVIVLKIITKMNIHHRDVETQLLWKFMIG